jgi:hypothetical protein
VQSDSVHSLLLVGILVSYLPQHVRIIRRGTSYGISPYFVLLGTTSGTSAFANILTLPTSRADMSCCQQISGFPCFAGILGIAQVGMQWSCFFLMCVFEQIPCPTQHPASHLTLQQPRPLRPLLPARRHDLRSRQRPHSAHLPHRPSRRSHLRRPRTNRGHPLVRLRLGRASTPASLGQLPRRLLHHPCLDPVLPADLHHLPAEESGQSEHSHDVHTDARQLCLECQSGGEARLRGLERLGCLSRDRDATGNVACHGQLL